MSRTLRLTIALGTRIPKYALHPSKHLLLHPPQHSLASVLAIQPTNNTPIKVYDMATDIATPFSLSGVRWTRK